MASVGNIRFLRCIMVVHGIFPKMMQDIIAQLNIPYEIIYNCIITNTSLMQSLTQAERDSVKKVNTVGVAHLHVDLLYKIVKSCPYLIDPPTRNWGSYPSDSENDIGDDIERIRIWRYMLVHTTEAHISETEFNDFFKTFIEVGKRLDEYLYKTTDDEYAKLVETYQSFSFEEEMKTNNGKTVENLGENTNVAVAGPEVRVDVGKIRKDFIKNAVGGITSQKRKNYFKLVTLIVEIGYNVIGKYLKEIVLGSDSFETYLNKEKHKLVHMYQPIQCCECKCEHIPDERLIERKKLLLLYDLNEQKLIHTHEKIEHGILTQMCICKYSAIPNIDVNFIDNTLANYIILKCGKNAIGVDYWIQQIKEIRNEVFHLSDKQEIEEEEFNSKWTKLRGFICGIAKRIDSSYAEAIENKILHDKQRIIIKDHVLEYELLCRDYWSNKCAEFEMQTQELKWPSSYLPFNGNEPIGRMLITDPIITTYKIEIVEDIVDKIYIQTHVYGRENDKKMFQATGLVENDMQTIYRSVFLNLHIPNSWDKTNFCRAIHEMRLKGTPDMNIRIKALSTDNLRIFAEIANTLLYDVQFLKWEIRRMIMRLISAASSITTHYAKVVVYLEILDTIEKETSIKKEIMEKQYFFKAALLEDILCRSIKDAIKVELDRTHVSFEEFINFHRHEIYHMCFNNTCCLCTRNTTKKYRKILNESHLRQIFDDHSRLSCHKTSVIRYCCCMAKNKISISTIDSYLACVLLLYFCNNVFWYSCLDLQGVTLQALLNSNQHEIYHLWHANTVCCQCSTAYMNKKQHYKFTKYDWKLLFSKIKKPCLFHKTIEHSDDIICCVRASRNLKVRDLRKELQDIILDKFCAMKDEIKSAMIGLIELYAYSNTGRISCENFKDIHRKFSGVITNITYSFATEITYRRKIRNISESLFDETTYTMLLLALQNKHIRIKLLNLNITDGLERYVLEHPENHPIEEENDERRLHPNGDNSDMLYSSDEHSCDGNLNITDHHIKNVREHHSKPLHVSLLCKEHPKYVDKFCISHELPLCVDCMEKHVKCTISKLENITRGVKTTKKFTSIEQRIHILSKYLIGVLPELEQEVSWISDDSRKFEKLIEESKNEQMLMTDKVKEIGLRNIQSNIMKIQSFQKKIFKMINSVIEWEEQIHSLRISASDTELFMYLPGLEKDLQRCESRLLFYLQNQEFDTIESILRLKTIGELTFHISYDPKERPSRALSSIQRPFSVASLQRIADIKCYESFVFEIPTQNKVNHITGCTFMEDGVMCFVDSKYRFILKKTDGIFQHFVLSSVPIDITSISNSEVAILHLSSIAILNVKKKQIKTFKFESTGKFCNIIFHDQNLIVSVGGCSFFVINLQGQKIKEINIDETLISCISCWKNNIFYANSDKNTIHSVDMDNGKSKLIKHVGGIVNSPTCMVSGEGGKLFVVGSDNINVVAVSVYGGQYKELVRRCRYIQHPKAIAYDALQRRVLICSPNGASVVYSIS